MHKGVTPGKNQGKDKQRKIHAAMVYSLSVEIAEKTGNEDRSHQQGGDEHYHCQ
jgi:hypothetical protein